MRKTTLKLMSLVVALVMILCVIPSASALNTLRDMVTDEEVTFIVILDDDCSIEQLAAEGHLASAAKQEELRELAQNVVKKQDVVATNIKNSIVGRGEIGYCYKAVINGFSLRANKSDMDAIKAVPGVKNVFISQTHELIQPVQEQEYEEETAVTVESSSVSTGVAEMQDNGYKGQGMVISIVDTTFDTNHEFLNGTVEDPKYTKQDMQDLLAQYSLINASLISDGGCQQITGNQVWKSEKVPFAYNYIYGNADTYPRCGESEHGIHVAGIAAGKNGTMPDGAVFNGVAPEAQLFLMACPSLTDEATMAAIDDSVLLGADVINMSWGMDYWELGVYTELFENCKMYGTYLCNAAGNSAMGWDETLPTADIVDYGSMGNPGETGFTTNVASADNTQMWQDVCYLTLDDGTKIPYLDQNEEYPFFYMFSEEEIEYVFVGELNEDNIDVEGKIAVFDRGTHGYYYADRIDKAVEGGAAGVIFLLTEGYTLSNYQISSDSVGSMPTASVDFEYTDALRGSGKLISDEGPTSELKQIGDPDNIQLSSFTSWGVFDNLDLNPEITAPGGYIYSSVAGDLYEYMSGTSMASPHMTGAVALMKQYLLANEESFSELTPAEQIDEIEARAMSTAKILTTYNPYSEIEDIPYSPRVQGAGYLQVPAAVATPVVLLGESGRTKVELRDGLTNDITFTFTAKNLTDEPVVYDANDIIVTTNDSIMGYVLDTCVYLNTTSTTMPKTVTVPANGTNEISVNIKLDPEQVAALEEVFTNGFFVDGYVVLQASDESVPTLSIPFMGFHGDWEAQKILDPYVYSEDEVPYTNQTRLASGEEHGYAQTAGYHYIDACETLGSNFFYNNYPTYYFPEGFEDEGVFNSDEYSAISPNNDGEFDYLCASTVTLRRTDEMWIEIYDADNELVYTAENEETANTDTVEYSVPRFYPTGVQVYNETFDELGLPEGDYTVKLYAQRGDKEPECVEMPFKIDLTAPTVDDVQVTREPVTVQAVVDYDENWEPIYEDVEYNNTTINVKVSDDQNLMAIAIMDTRTGEILSVLPVAGDQEKEFEFNLGALAPEYDHFSVFAVDYAWNQSYVVTDSLPGDINEDGVIDNQDLVILSRVLVGIQPWDDLDGYQQFCCDFNGDGWIDNIDLVTMARYIVGLGTTEEDIVEEEDIEEDIEQDL